jgi:tetratricopeptide (TPR) repeat protein
VLGERTTGGLYDAKGDLPAAARNYASALTLSLGNPQATRGMAFLLYEVGLGQEAARLFPDEGLTRDFLVRDYDGAARRAQAVLKENPSDFEAALNLLFAHNLAGRSRESVDAALVLWRSSNQRPTALPPVGLVQMALAAREAGDDRQAREWREAAAKSLQERERVGMVGQVSGGLHLARFAMAAYDNAPAELVSQLDLAIDAGYRDRERLGTELFAPFARQPEFRQRIERLESILADQRQQILAMMCAPDAKEHGWDPAPETCAGRETASASGTVQ